MNHFNFFVNVQKEKRQMNVPLISGVLVGAAVIVFAFLFLDLKMKLNKTESQLAYLQSVEADPAFIEAYAQEKNLEQMLQTAEKNYAMLASADWLVQKGTTVDNPLIAEIEGCIPANTRFTRVSFSGSSVQMECMADAMTSMIQFLRNLQANERFTNVFIDTVSVSGDDGFCTFSLRFAVQEKGSDKQ